jgi:hypothetical protein
VVLTARISLGGMYPTTRKARRHASACGAASGGSCDTNGAALWELETCSLGILNSWVTSNAFSMQGDAQRSRSAERAALCRKFQTAARRCNSCSSELSGKSRREN